MKLSFLLNDLKNKLLKTLKKHIKFLKKKLITPNINPPVS